ncbi:MAG: hypothetical protein IPP94_13855 [Ignavibacteria bacterium]|nr:hypothetical protein [Ignavibacteria bacterium]
MHMIRLLFALLVFVLVSASLRGQGWEWQNPTPQGHAVNDIVMIDEGWVIAACENGTVMRSGDGGRTWRSASIGHENLERLTLLGHGTILMTAENSRMYRSTNLGMNWTLVYDDAQSTSYSDIATVDDTTAIVKFNNASIVMTRDGGLTWTPIAVPVQIGFWMRAIAVQSPARWYIIGDRLVYRTMDAGESWEADSSYTARGLIRLVWIDSLYGYQLREGQVLQTRDGGVTWQEMNLYGFDSNVSIVAGPRLGSSVYCLSDGNIVVNKSSDGGRTWDISLTGAAFKEAYPYAISFASESVGLVAGDGGRILRTSDGGASWTIVHGAGYLGYISDVHFSNPRDGFALTYSTTLLTTSNGGNRWDETVPSGVFSLRKASMYSPDGGYAYALDSRYNTALFSTTDAGRTWRHAGAVPITFDYVHNRMAEGICAVSRDTLFIGVSYGNLLRSTDAGLSWDSLFVAQEFTNQYMAGSWVFAFPPHTVQYAGSNGVARSDDLGNTWKYRPLRYPHGFQELQFFSPASGVALLSTGNGNTIGKSTDGGQTWTTGSTGGNEVQMHFFDEQRGVTLASRLDETNVVRKTTDGGASWTDMPMKERVYWNGWFWLNPNEAWAYGAAGTIRHTGNGGFTSAPVSTGPASFTIDALFPNPFSPARHRAATVRFTLDGAVPKHAELAVFDAIGRRVATLVDGMMDGGQHAAVLDPGRFRTSLAPGVYSLRLRWNGQLQSRTFIVE